MQEMERRFGKAHPEMEGYSPTPPHLLWLQSAFLRLHRRRQYDTMGHMEPITYEQMTSFGERVLKLNEELMDFFVSAIEEIDNAVLGDQVSKG